MFLQCYKSEAGRVVFTINGIGMVREKCYDDRTLVFEDEFQEGRVVYPNRVRFYAGLFSEEPIYRHHVREHVRGYGLGRVENHDVRAILDSLERRKGIYLSIASIRKE
jgi:hypothetical protein